MSLIDSSKDSYDDIISVNELIFITLLFLIICLFQSYMEY